MRAGVKPFTNEDPNELRRFRREIAAGSGILRRQRVLRPRNRLLALSFRLIEVEGAQ